LRLCINIIFTTDNNKEVFIFHRKLLFRKETGIRFKFIKDKKWLIPTRPKEEAILKFYKELNPNLHFVLAEAKMYTEGLKENLAGTADILFYYKDPKDDSKSGLCVFDYKTNQEIRKSYSRENGKMLLEPFSDY
jgi:hypothetical protein